MKEWILLDQQTDVVKMSNIPAPICKILRNRGYKDEATVKKFLTPELKNLHSPFLFPDMEQAARRIVEAKKRGEKIMIYGDYDADGITATAMLVNALKSLGIGATYYIPHRMKEGYGLSMAGIDFATKHGFSVLITVDCGTTAFDEIEKAKDAGIDVIVCDHHEPAEKLPVPYAFFNPKIENCPYPFKELAGAGVAFKLIQALFASFGAPDRAFEYLDLCALGTVVDVAPLVEENRILAKFGIEEVIRTKNIGLETLLRINNLTDKPISTYHLSFIVGPRINASGRISDAVPALKIFLTRDHDEALVLAQKLDEENRKRQKIEEEILNESLEMVADKDLAEKRVIVLAKDNWHEGVVGIVASRLAEKFYRPAIIISVKDNQGKGSGRSVPGFHLADAVKNCHDHLISYGGHKQAVGLTIEPARIREFEQAINQCAAQFPSELLVPKTYVDTTLELAEINETLIAFLRKFEPTGVENPTPTFLGRGLEVVGYPRVIASNHLKFALREKGKVLPAIGYGFGERIVDLKVGKTKIDVIFSIDEDSFLGKKKTTLKIKDMRESGTDVAE